MANKITKGTLDDPILRQFVPTAAEQIDTEGFGCNPVGDLESRLTPKLLNQSVLLRGVNDEVDTLAELCEKLVDHGIVPYYLHQLDRTQGTAHFEVEEQEGLALMRALTMRLPGYAVPKYVREVPSEASKTMIGI